MISFNNLYVCLFLIYFISANSDGYRILVISPFNSKSHNNMLESIAKALVSKGHRVDMISHFELKNPPKNYTTIVNLDGTMPKHVNNWTMEMVDIFRATDLTLLLISDYGNNFCDLMSQEKIQRLIKNPPKDPPYDLVITEAFVANCYFGFGHVFKVPVVVASLLQFLWYDEILGNPMSTAYTASYDTESSRVVTFWDRVKNHFRAHYNNYRIFKGTEEYQTEAMRKYLSPDIPNIRQVEKQVALQLLNTYHSFHGIRPFIPAVVQVGGIEIEQSEAKITPELKVWLDESTDGVIYFTLGSMVIIEDFPKEILLGIYASFAKLSPIRILMKIINKSKLPPGLPDNIRIMSWIPQIPVLRHKNTKVFITHGGINSVSEALYFGVPMIGLPLFGDQQLNIRLLEDKNVTYEMNFKEISEKSLDRALSAILYDPKYREGAKLQSRLYRDRPMSASDTAVFWVEYIIRNGANSLRSPAMDMPWWKAELLDVYAFFFVCILLMSYIAFLFLRKAVCLIFSISNPTSQDHVKRD